MFTFDLEESRQELVLVLLGGDGICELLAIVEWLQQGLEAIVNQRHRGGGSTVRMLVVSGFGSRSLKSLASKFCMPRDLSQSIR